jgi:hypothetical protein
VPADFVDPELEPTITVGLDAAARVAGELDRRLLCMVNDLPEHGSPVVMAGCLWEQRLSVAEEETVGEVAVPDAGRRRSGRSRFAKALKWP